MAGKARLALLAISAILTAPLSADEWPSFGQRPIEAERWGEESFPEPIPEFGETGGPPGLVAAPLACHGCGHPLATGCSAAGPGIVAEESCFSGGVLGRGASLFRREDWGGRSPFGFDSRERWTARPLSIGGFAGAMHGSPLIDDWLGQKQGGYGGVRLGWDFDSFWGCEMRLGLGSVSLYDTARAREARVQADLTSGAAYPGRHGDIGLWDIDLLWYPWGEPACRPYFLIGMGAAWVDFADSLDDRTTQSAFQMPIGLGVKYRVRDWLALRLELADNIVLGGGGFETLHQVSLTVGMEYRFGGARTAYWPYNPGRHYW